MDNSQDCSPDHPNPISEKRESLPKTFPAVESPQTSSERWREVAAMAAGERDPQKLSHLIDELLRLLDKNDEGKPGRVPPGEEK